MDADCCGATSHLRRGRIFAPFLGIKAIDLLVTAFTWRRSQKNNVEASYEPSSAGGVDPAARSR